MAMREKKPSTDTQPLRGFEREVAAYDLMKGSLERDYRHKWVVIFNAELAGVYGSEDEACADGALRFGAAEFLCRQVGAPVRTYVIPTLITHGLMDADRQA